MTTITCAISGIKFTAPYCTNLTIPHTAGYYHPIFAASHTQLDKLYRQHVKQELTANDSYLLFLAIAHSTGLIDWQSPITSDPTDPITIRLISNKISKLISVIAKSASIKHPTFEQPTCRVNPTLCSIQRVADWIDVWQENITDFLAYRQDAAAYERLARVTNVLTLAIKSTQSLPNYTELVANWAAIAGDFPAELKQQYKEVIVSCFDSTKMFNTPISLIKEVKDYCECNIEVGSIHFHELSKALNKAVSSHIDYLGMTYKLSDYALLSDRDTATNSASTLKTDSELAVITDHAPTSEPRECDYPSKLAYLKAKMAYRVAGFTAGVTSNEQ